VPLLGGVFRAGFLEGTLGGTIAALRRHHRLCRSEYFGAEPIEILARARGFQALEAGSLPPETLPATSRRSSRQVALDCWGAFHAQVCQEVFGTIRKRSCSSLEISAGP